MSSTAWLILTIVGALGSAACLYGIYGDKKRGYPALKAVDSQFEMPDMRFRYTPEELFACLEKLGTEGRQRLRRLWGLDSALALFLVLVLAVVSHNLAAFRWLRWAMYGLAVLRSLLDLLENGLLLRVDRHGEGRVRLHHAQVGCGDPLGHRNVRGSAGKGLCAGKIKIMPRSESFGTRLLLEK